jgi:hypothetical protein
VVFEYDDKIQELYAGNTTGQQYYPLKSARLHYFGGTSGHWGGMCTPLDPIDFMKRDWIPLQRMANQQTDTGSILYQGSKKG